MNKKGFAIISRSVLWALGFIILILGLPMIYLPISQSVGGMGSVESFVVKLYPAFVLFIFIILGFLVIKNWSE